jgi:nucleotide-binding universal stress UspA family protein
MKAVGGAILVGVDGSAAALDAARWAAVEARLRGRAVRLVSAYTTLAFADTPELTGAAGPADAARRRARNAIRAAETAVREVTPDVPVLGQVRIGPAVRTLADLSRRAAMVVVGRDRPASAAGRLGSVTAGVVARARCPVVVVGTLARSAPLNGHRIVVGASLWHPDDAALAFAFGEAFARRVAVDVVDAWNPPHALWRPMTPGDVARAADTEMRRLRQWAERWHAAYPQVPMRLRITDREPVAALLSAAREAELLVVGPRRHEGVGGLLPGAMNNALIGRTSCPIAVVR